MPMIRNLVKLCSAASNTTCTAFNTTCRIFALKRKTLWVVNETRSEGGWLGHWASAFGGVRAPRNSRHSSHRAFEGLDFSGRWADLCVANGRIVRSALRIPSITHAMDMVSAAGAMPSRILPCRLRAGAAAQNIPGFLPLSQSLFGKPPSFGSPLIPLDAARIRTKLPRSRQLSWDSSG